MLIYIRAWKACAVASLNGKVFFQGVLDGPEGRRLQIRVPDSTWRQEMQFQRQTMLQNYCNACRKLGLHEELLPTSCSIVA